MGVGPDALLGIWATSAHAASEKVGPVPLSAKGFSRSAALQVVLTPKANGPFHAAKSSNLLLKLAQVAANEGSVRCDPPPTAVEAVEALDRPETGAPHFSSSVTRRPLSLVRRSHLGGSARARVKQVVGL